MRKSLIVLFVLALVAFCVVSCAPKTPEPSAAPGAVKTPGKPEPAKTDVVKPAGDVAKPETAKTESTVKATDPKATDKPVDPKAPADPKATDKGPATPPAKGPATPPAKDKP